jgi:hypothetical protein
MATQLKIEVLPSKAEVVSRVERIVAEARMQNDIAYESGDLERVAENSAVAIQALISAEEYIYDLGELEWITWKLLAFITAEGWPFWTESKEMIVHLWQELGGTMPHKLQCRFDEVNRRYQPMLLDNIFSIATGKPVQSPEAAKARVLRDAKRAKNRADRLNRQFGIEASDGNGNQPKQNAKPNGGKKVAGKKK